MNTKRGFPVVATTPPAIPAPLVDVALIDAPTCAAVGDVSVSWWYAEVAAGRAPQPATRGHRCTRWRLSEVRTYWVQFAEGKHGMSPPHRLGAKAKGVPGRKEAAAHPMAAVTSRTTKGKV